MHCGAGVSVGEGVEVSVTVVEGVGEAERDTVVVPVGVVDAEAPVDMVAERGVVVGERVAVDVTEGGGLNTTLAIAPNLITLPSDVHHTVKAFPVVVHEAGLGIVLPVRPVTRLGEPVVGPL
jgi:hypothetical protein